MQNHENRPPYIRFQRRPIEDRNASIKAGHYVARDVDFAILQRPGSRDTVERPVSELLAEWTEKARQGMIPVPWVEDVRKGYEFWQRGEELPPNGTPIKGWQVLSPAQQLNVIAAGVRTVEDLAAFPDSQLSELGIGAVGLKQKARAWLDAAQDVGKLAEQNAALQAQVAAMQAQITAMMEQISTAKQESPAAKIKTALNNAKE